MLNFFLTWILTAVSLVITAQLVSGFDISSFPNALVTAGVLGLVNAIVKPVIKLLTLPLTFVTFGLFLLVINAVMLYVVASLVPNAFMINSFWAAFVGAIILSLVSGVLGFITGIGR